MTDSPTPAHRWHDQHALLRDLAVADLETTGEVQPTLVAFTGDDALFLATLRPFDRGGHADPITEVGALAWGLGADRVMISLSGRAWSLHDPIPPVLDDVGDLRQRVLAVHAADGTVDPPQVISTVVPFDVEDGRVRLGPAITDDAVAGWVPAALLALVGSPAGRVDEEDVGQQILRCERLGHRIAWAPGVVDDARRRRALPLGGAWTGAGD